MCIFNSDHIINAAISIGEESFEHANVLSEKINFSALGGPGVTIFALMTFTQCTSMSDLKFDSVAPPGGQIQQYVSFSALFESPTKDMAQKYGSTVKNLT